MSNYMQTAIYAILISFFLCTLVCPRIIPFLSRLKFGQYVRDDGPESHLRKTGTPTMGGIVILICFLTGSLYWLRSNPDGLAVVAMTLAYGAIGFMDDYIKVVKKRSLGLRAYQKMIAQVAVAVLFYGYIRQYTDLDTTVVVPFANHITFDLGFLYAPFVVLVMVGTVNSVNLTDGLDGLASGITVMVATFFMITACAFQSGIAPVAGAAVGSLLGFLLFNSYPAKVFMGDTGSLALGGFIAAAALLLRMPLFLPIVGIIYIMEALSDIIQVLWYKKTGKRVFKMAPIHHHFELLGWNETKVVSVFYIITAIACLIGFLGVKTFA